MTPAASLQHLKVPNLLKPPELPKLHDVDFQLAGAILARDRKATARLVEMHADAVHRYVWRRLHPRVEMVDDLVQESFVAAWRALKTYSGDASLQTWLVSIARFKVEDYYRRTLGGALTRIESEVDLSTIPDDLDLDVSFDEGRRCERVSAVLAMLPYEYAVALRWRYWEGRSAREMAAFNGRTEKAVERLLARARQQFKEQWLDAERRIHV